LYIWLTRKKQPTKKKQQENVQAYHKAFLGIWAPSQRQ